MSVDSGYNLEKRPGSRNHLKSSRARSITRLESKKSASKRVFVDPMAFASFDRPGSMSNLNLSLSVNNVFARGSIEHLHDLKEKNFQAQQRNLGGQAKV